MSNHLGDTNKMVDTPRTEAEVNRQKCWSDDLVTIDANFACQLERELNAANSKIELLMSANADVARIAGERDAAEKRIKLLEAVTNDPHALWVNWLRGNVKLPVGIGDVRQYQDRIKRLEDAGDDLYANCDLSRWDSTATTARKLADQNAWLKAKEAKL
jgi:hypothetical protein